MIRKQYQFAEAEYKSNAENGVTQCVQTIEKKRFDTQQH